MGPVNQEWTIGAKGFSCRGEKLRGFKLFLPLIQMTMEFSAQNVPEFMSGELNYANQGRFSSDHFTTFPFKALTAGEIRDILGRSHTKLFLRIAFGDPRCRNWSILQFDQ